MYTKNTKFLRPSLWRPSRKKVSSSLIVNTLQFKYRKQHANAYYGSNYSLLWQSHAKVTYFCPASWCVSTESIICFKKHVASGMGWTTRTAIPPLSGPLDGADFHRRTFQSVYPIKQLSQFAYTYFSLIKGKMSRFEILWTLKRSREDGGKCVSRQWASVVANL
jgi:hypothetical protein